MSNRAPLLTDKLTSGTPLNLRREKGRSVAFSYSGNGKDRSKAYTSNRTKPRKKK
jgi:hypothetical protein